MNIISGCKTNALHCSGMYEFFFSDSKYILGMFGFSFQSSVWTYVLTEAIQGCVDKLISNTKHDCYLNPD